MLLIQASEAISEPSQANKVETLAKIRFNGLTV